MRLTKGELSRIVAAANVAIAHYAFSLAEGAWNPNFNASDAGPYSEEIVADLRKYADAIEKRDFSKTRAGLTALAAARQEGGEHV